MATNYDDKGPINLVCPRCDHMIPNDEMPGAYPGALSRWGSREIEVCSACGTDEALVQFQATMDGKSAQLSVHPIHGERPWAHVPGGV